MTAAERVIAAYRRIDEAGRPEVWISLRPLGDALADALEVDAGGELVDGLFCFAGLEAEEGFA
ncbi:MAG: hypothetical protein QOH90_2353, partial [Actinomycetota bacterium]|nr:hypothetical protein [Actinomycetota bacterium]